MTKFKEILTLLTKNQIEFIVIGGAAATAHGTARLTLDLDIVYGRTPENILKLAKALKPLDPYLRGAPKGLPFLWDEQTIARGLNFTLTTSLGDFDILGEITGGGPYEELLPFSEKMQLYGIECRVITLKKLIEVKTAAGRPKDFEAIAELEALQEEKDK